ncbi:hypothetical protein Lal_00038356 [Lupinus albus]|nr:hypothetical protein Lal_00038356 [Lupinus albus]
MEYQTHFERLSNQVLGLTSKMTLNLFLPGLNPAIARELAIQQPFLITHAIGLEKLVESKIAASKPITWFYARSNIVKPTTPTMGSAFTIVHTTSSTTLSIKCKNAEYNDCVTISHLEDKVSLQGEDNVGSSEHKITTEDTNIRPKRITHSTIKFKDYN